jgi:DNA-nicking Smr family endonuclease
MAKRGRKSDPPDFHLWIEVTRTVSPLPRRPVLEPADGEVADAPPSPPLPRARPRIFPSFPSYQAPVQKAEREERPRIEPKMRRKLMRGRIEIDGTLDLHGMHQIEARSALNRFLASRWSRGDRTILVITGKGLKKLDAEGTQIIERGVLRSMLPVWLSEPGLAEIVAGWDYSAQMHGGEGAFYVRLKRARA